MPRRIALALAPALALALSGCPADAVPTVLINEYMAANASTLTDETGAFPDWIEIYNPSSSAELLAGVWITDDLADPLKHLLDASIEVPAGGYVVLFADGDTDQGPEHLPFRLSAAGEELGLYYLDEDNVPVPLTETEYGPQQVDVSQARFPDGGDTWADGSPATPGATNG